MKKLFLILAAALIFHFVGCKARTNETVTENKTAETQNALKTDDGKLSVDFKTAPNQIKAGENADLLFTFKNGSGETIRDLQIVHEKPMHLLVVSDDLDEFYHLHPEIQADGIYKASFTFPNGGNYKLYTDFTPLDNAQVIKNFSLSVSGDERAAKEIKPDAKFEKTVDNLRVLMKPDGDLVSSEELMLSFRVSDAQTNKPVTDLENYLGAKAHFVVISQDLKEFVHVHPLSTDNVRDGEHAHDSMNSETNAQAAHQTGEHQHASKLTAQDAESIVAAHVSFPKAALYKIFAQFQRGGRVITVPFVVKVEENEAEKEIDMRGVKIPEGAFKIVVSEYGFTPQEISLKQGEPLKLAFYRADAKNCGSEVVFKDLNIRKKLPIGKVVLIDVPTDKTGEISFACGMDMLKGKILVQ